MRHDQIGPTFQHAGVHDLRRFYAKPRRGGELKRRSLAMELPSKRRVDFDDEALINEEDDVLAKR